MKSIDDRLQVKDWIKQCFTSPPTQYRLYWRRFLQVERPNQQYQSTEGDVCQLYLWWHQKQDSRRCAGCKVEGPEKEENYSTSAWFGDSLQEHLIRANCLAFLLRHCHQKWHLSPSARDGRWLVDSICLSGRRSPHFPCPLSMPQPECQTQRSIVMTAVIVRTVPKQ